MPVKRGWGWQTGAVQRSPRCCGGAAASCAAACTQQKLSLFRFCNPKCAILLFYSFSPRGTVVVDCLGRGGAPLPSLPRLAAWFGKQQQCQLQQRHHKWRVSTRDAVIVRFCCFFCVSFSILLPFSSFSSTLAAEWRTAAEAAQQWCSQVAGCHPPEAKSQVSLLFFLGLVFRVKKSLTLQRPASVRT